MAPIWEKQRILRPSRVTVIAQAKAKAKLPNIIFPGVISFYNNKSDNTYGTNLVFIDDTTNKNNNNINNHRHHHYRLHHNHQQ